MNQPFPERFPRRLADADSTIRLFITVFLVVLTAGYATGLMFVSHTSGGTAQGLAEEYRGSANEAGSAELKYEKSVDEMYIFLHNHVLSLSLVFLAVGGIFSFSSRVSRGLRSFLMIEPLIAVGTTFGGIWLMRFVAEQFIWLVLLSGISMAGCYLAMVTLILTELWSRR